MLVPLTISFSNKPEPLKISTHVQTFILFKMFFLCMFKFTYFHSSLLTVILIKSEKKQHAGFERGFKKAKIVENVTLPVL